MKDEVAVMDTRVKLEAELDAARVDLANVGIKFELLTLDMERLSAPFDHGVIRKH
jgi:hypothetical protein